MGDNRLCSNGHASNLASLKAPSPSQIIAVREGMGLTQSEAASLVHSVLRSWQQWEAGDRKMKPAVWELFCLKCGVMQLAKVHKRT
ncbi:XRE family transcriptional regulator (plasmid) [Comamonas aquatica]|nr:XRE family transcriptional regulator [Comamonas aquatica]